MRFFVFLILYTLPLFFGVAYAENLEKVKSANGKTPVNFVFCNNITSECEVIARFEDLENCERHKTFYAASCDRVSKPGFAICDLSSLRSGNGKEYDVYCVPN